MVDVRRKVRSKERPYLAVTLDKYRADGGVIAPATNTVARSSHDGSLRRTMFGESGVFRDANAGATVAAGRWDVFVPAVVMTGLTTFANFEKGEH